MFATVRPRTIAQPSVRVSAPAKRASRATARAHARANDGDVNLDRRAFVRRAAFAALSATLVAPREVRARTPRALDAARARALDARARTRDGRDGARLIAGARATHGRRRGDATSRARASRARAMTPCATR